MANKIVHVAAAAIWNSNKELLIAKRPDDKHQGGLWEFPGGKVEQGESVLTALTRELDEELGLHVLYAEKLIQVPYHYPDKSVLLDVYSVTEFDGEPWGKEGQQVRWVHIDNLSEYEFPAANKPILNACLLPKSLAITPYHSDIEEIRHFIKTASDAGASGLVFRSPLIASEEEDLLPSVEALIKSASQSMARSDNFFAVNTSVAVANKLELKAVHLNGENLTKLQHRKDFNGQWLGASCHNAEELADAMAKEVDYVMLSPVQSTSSHPETEALGWEVFSDLAESSTVPVYALGGMQVSDIVRAVNHGGQGIAAISAWLEE